MCKLTHLLGGLYLLLNANKALGQLVKGSFGLATSDPICIQCQDAIVGWYGGIVSRLPPYFGPAVVKIWKPPYVLSVSGYHNSYELTNVDIVAVAPSVDASCVNVTNPLVTDSTTSLTLDPITTSHSTATGSATATNTSSQSNSGSPTAAIVGGIASGVVVLLILLFCLLWFKRKNRRYQAASGAQNDLDLDHSGYVAEPFTIQTAGDADSFERTPKMRTVAASGPLEPDRDYSNSGTLATTASDATPGSSTQLISNEPPPTVQTLHSPATLRKATLVENRTGYNGPMQEQDAGVSLSRALQPDEPTTLPPAYDSSWRT
ncbi:unnamed protein product [Rhizoctonia solani]|uniref:Uncharacterized protein n=1 Tax=Rhizoctonia solani TaxID=456999 RepID=A0A8H3BRR0_9AGAM|nr:unnamed protein product [Rhizoctonia solani]